MVKSKKYALPEAPPIFEVYEVVPEDPIPPFLLSSPQCYILTFNAYAKKNKINLERRVATAAMLYPRYLEWCEDCGEEKHS